ncbi:hypothetical protein K443DRAFT_159425 [Laccaria amethystina LaAM-08-1]|uniref:Uncharacterized protein n=1 Tax=Laccaria amethystina LaAM-08-1 TaxID=1095629 RepID=A0A0C9XUY2_9AGAR|nr:hypothetical protein K443DRAFT_159425 [Laccaria amethystina LaAM-08-1]
MSARLRHSVAEVPRNMANYFQYLPPQDVYCINRSLPACHRHATAFAFGISQQLRRFSG